MTVSLTIEQRQELVRDVHVSDDVADAAWATLKRYGALDLAGMLGLDR